MGRNLASSSRVVTLFRNCQVPVVPVGVADVGVVVGRPLVRGRSLLGGGRCSRVKFFLGGRRRIVLFGGNFHRDRLLRPSGVAAGAVPIP